MNEKMFKNSNEFDAIFQKCLNRKNITISWIQKHFKMSFQKATILYQEAKAYDDELFLHSTKYELSFLEEPPTPARAMEMFNISYPLAKRVIENFMED